MPVASRPPIISPNNAISNALTHTEQFQELFFQVKSWMVAAGATIESSNGGGVAGAGDNIANAAAVTMGAAGTGAWFVALFSAGTISNSEHRVLFYVDDATDPRQLVGIRAGPGTASGGSTSALPTLAGHWHVARTFNLHPFTTAQNLRWSSWRTASPNRPYAFIVKQEGVGQAASVIFCISNTDASGGGSGNERWAWFVNGSGNPLTNSAMGNSTSFLSINAAGSADATTIMAASIWSIASTWASGLDGFGNAHPQPPLVGQTPVDGRTIGVAVDMYALPQNLSFGLLIDQAEVAASQDPLRVCFGDVALYWPNGVTVQ
jgi:hypothetical protein